MTTSAAPAPHLHWTISFRASCLHAAEALAHGQLVVDTRLAEAITGPAQELRQAIHAAQLPRTQFWRHLVGLSVMVDGLRELAERAVSRTVGPAGAGPIAATLVPSMAAVEAAMRKALPELLDELALRERPLREQWEARGPGLLQRIACWTDPRVLPAEARVVLVHPALGGGGAAHIPYNIVHIEAVLTNPIAELPEILRLGWLLAQLNSDLPAFNEQVPGARLSDVAELAMLLVTLQAAEDVEFGVMSPERLDLALKAWNIVAPTEVDLLEVLWRWWGTYVDTRPRWDIAFTALDRMLGTASAG
ncbi:MAG: hypothetical protein ACYC4U_05885 [Pirellulaceae bacterium]